MCRADMEMKNPTWKPLLEPVAWVTPEVLFLITTTTPMAGTATAAPQSSQLFAAALLVPRRPDWRRTQLTNDAHQGVSSSVAFKVVVWWYSRMRLFC